MQRAPFCISLANGLGLKEETTNPIPLKALLSKGYSYKGGYTWTETHDTVTLEFGGSGSDGVDGGGEEAALEPPIESKSFSIDKIFPKTTGEGLPSSVKKEALATQLESMRVAGEDFASLDSAAWPSIEELIGLNGGILIKKPGAEVLFGVFLGKVVWDSVLYWVEDGKAYVEWDKVDNTNDFFSDSNFPQASDFVDAAASSLQESSEDGSEGFMGLNTILDKNKRKFVLEEDESWNGALWGTGEILTVKKGQEDLDIEEYMRNVQQGGG